MSISLVSLVVLGIFGRNTGFGPSMSLNNRTFMFHMFGEYVCERNTLHLGFGGMVKPGGGEFSGPMFS